MNNVLHNRLVKDALTGLVSRYQYSEEMKIKISQNPNMYGVFTFIDIDDFKSVNDIYGHGVGDAYLIGFANRLMALPVENMIHMRIGGDEFGLFSYGLSEVDSVYVNSLWETIKRTVLSKPLEIDGKQMKISISAGMAVYGKDTENIYELIDFADAAMYHAKKSGKDQMRLFIKSTDVPEKEK
ncbi:MAG: GGDEF domain-containing protein [Clostridia bacterium]|nr:GGDEF domain-containing protein [Clostridia bacterium]